MKYLYYLYQLCVALPVTIVATIITGITVAAGCLLGGGHFFGYYHAHHLPG